MLGKPNILLIITDQQRYDSLGCYGCEAINTPNLDRFASEGVLFDNNYVNNQICTPSRASIHTGKHLPGHGVYKLYDVLPGKEILFTKRLKEIGYETALFGKLHVSSRIYEQANRHPNDGFDIYEWCHDPVLNLDVLHNGYGRWLKDKNPDFLKELIHKGRKLHHIPRNFHYTHWAAERTIKYINEWNGERPFFIEMSIVDPHDPYNDYPIEMNDFVDFNKIVRPIYNRNEIKSKPDEIKREHENSYLGAFNAFNIDEIMEMRKGYYSSIALADLEIGRVLDTVKNKGIEKNTLIIFVSDHGDMLGDHQLFTKGCFFYDPCTKTPLIIKWPEQIEGGQKISNIVQPHDIAATILSAAGYENDNLLKIMPDSFDLLPIIKGEMNKIHNYAICCYRNSGINNKSEYWNPAMYATMIRDDRYKINIYHNNFEIINGELFDMKNDPYEFENLWVKSDYLDTKQRMIDYLLNWYITQEINHNVEKRKEMIPSASQKMNNQLKYK